MKKETKLKYDIISVIINIILFIFMILSILTENKNCYAWYWIIVSVMLIFEVWYIKKWEKPNGIDLDKTKSKSIRYSYDGLTTGTIVFSGLIYLTVMGLEMFDKSIKTNIFIMLLIYVMLTISLLLNYLAIHTANKDTKILIDKMYKNKKEDNKNGK